MRSPTRISSRRSLRGCCAWVRESSALALVATRCADYYESKLTDQIDRLTGIVGPAAIIVIATVIGTLIVSIMSTLLSIDQMVM